MKRLILLLCIAFPALAQNRVGEDPFVDSEAPGGTTLSVTETTTAINTRQHGSQFIFKLNPSASDSTGDTRGVYIRTISLGSFSINETVGLSSYLYHEGSGNLTTAYGTTNQFLNRGTGTVSYATGAFNQARQQDFAGSINLARGSLNAVQNWRTSGTGINLGYGAHNKIELAGSGGTIDSGYASYNEIRTSASGNINWGYPGAFIVNNLDSGATIWNSASIRLGLVNNGSVRKYSAIQIDAPTGNAPSVENYAITSLHPGPSRLAGSTRIGSTSLPANTLDVTGSFGRGAPYRMAGDYVVGSADNWLINDKTGSDNVVALPGASAYPGRELYFTNWQGYAVLSASANVIPITGGSATTAILPDQPGAWCVLVSDGANWITTQLVIP
jgi:hypothetical protein